MTLTACGDLNLDTMQAALGELEEMNLKSIQRIAQKKYTLVALNGNTQSLNRKYKNIQRVRARPDQKRLRGSEMTRVAG